jgi:polysaccharide pyruvyl transferase WcaK-like protein
MVIRNLQLVLPAERVAKSKVMQFISTNANIGNFMPVKAIQNMLGEETDVWNMHRPVDWQFVNENYKAVVIGGAGLLARAFNQFWIDCAAQCKLPIIVWGIGTCIVDGVELEETICDREAVKSVFDRALMVNVRDEVTAELYAESLGDRLSITACPTVDYLCKFEAAPQRNTVTLSVHPELADEHTHDQMQAICERLGFTVLRTENVQTPEEGLEDIIRNYYCRSELVIATRLHGAITAYGLGIPYLAWPGDEKVREFQRLFGGGQFFDSMDALAELLAEKHERLPLPQVDGIRSFGARAKAAIAALG